jgi:fructokinase
LTTPARRVVGVGEILWDLLPAGERLGGAPFNVVAHLRRFGWDATFVSAVGRDELGRRALDEARRLGVDASRIGWSDLPTGVVRVRIDASGNPDFEIVSPAAYEVATTGAAIPSDLLVFGTLAQRFPRVRAATERLAAATGGIRLYDVNLRRGCWDPPLVADLLGLATIAKLNADEQDVLARELDLPGADAETLARSTAQRYDLRGVCVTRGADGAALLLDGTYTQAPAPRTNVVDTIGAGDAFAAALGHGVAAGWSAPDILAVAGRLGSFVASRQGAIPDWDQAQIVGR